MSNLWPDNYSLVETNQAVGVLGTYLGKRKAERVAQRCNRDLIVPSCRYKAVRSKFGVYQVVAFQNILKEKS